MLAPVRHILPLTNIRRVRTLPVPGKVLVNPGQKVSASGVIAEASVPAGHTFLDIRRGLGIPQAAAAERCIIRKQGDRLEKGDVIAETGGLFSRIVRAPADGEVVSISGGQVLLRTRTITIEVLAGFDGQVAELVPEHGAIIETNGALIQGVWGNGRIDSGLFKQVAREPGAELTAADIDVSLRGSVVMGGRCASPEALRAGAMLPLRGLILPSMPAELIPVAASLNYPILITEGFGTFPYNELTYKLLSTSEERVISVNAVFNLSSGERPELIIPLPAVGQAAPETDYFAPDQTVRVQGAPHSGRIGTIVQVRQGLYTLPNGLKAPVADVQLDHETRVAIPLANLEVIE